MSLAKFDHSHAPKRKPRLPAPRIRLERWKKDFRDLKKAFKDCTQALQRWKYASEHQGKASDNEKKGLKKLPLGLADTERTV
jgi:hypothetical protein